jgi:hypothetical protein
VRAVIVVAAFVLLPVARTAVAQTSADRAFVAVTVARATAIGSQGAKLDDRQQLELRAPLPPLLMRPVVLVPTFGYETRWIGVDGAPDAPDRDADRTFHRFQLGLMTFRPLAPRWLLIGGVNATARTDLELELDAGMDMSWTAFAMANYRFEGLPGASVTAGVVALYPIDTLPMFPVATFAYRSDVYTVEIGVPRIALLAAVRDGLELGLTGAFDRQAFRTDLSGMVQAPEARYVRQTALTFGPTVNASLGAADLWLSASVGLDVLNDFAVLDEDRDVVELAMEPSTKPAPYARVLLTWRPPRRQSK